MKLKMSNFYNNLNQQFSKLSNFLASINLILLRVAFEAKYS